MKHILILSALLLGNSVQAQVQDDEIVEKTWRPNKSKKGRTENEPIGVVNWSRQYIEASGESFFNLERFSIPGQAESMAREGAKAMAMANLLETAGNVKVTKTTTVTNMITQDVSIRTEVEGLIRGAEVVSETVGANSVKVIMRLYLYGSNGLSEPFRPEEDKPSPVNPDKYVPDPKPIPNPEDQTAPAKEESLNAGEDTAISDPLKQTVAELVKASKNNENAPIPLLHMSKKDSLKSLLTLIPQNIFNEQGELIVNLEEIFRKTGRSPKILNYSDKLLKMLNEAGVKTEKIEAYYKNGRIVVKEDQIKKSGKFWEWVKKQKPGSESILWKVLPLLVGAL